MSVNVQARGQRHQLRVKHRLLPRAFFFTFDGRTEADAYGQQLQALLDRGIVPAELLAAPAKRDDPLVVEVVRAYLRDAPHLTPSDDALLASMLSELVGIRMGTLTYAWTERYVRTLKDRMLAPGSIRKRVGALARVLDWHLRSTNSVGANALRLLPVGYSQYTPADRAGLERAPVDVHRDRRLAPDEEARIVQYLDELRLLFDLIVGTGLRLREAYRLRVDQLDLPRGVIRVEGSKGARGVIKPRVVPLVPSLRTALATAATGRTGLLFDFWGGEDAALKATTSRLSYLFAKAFKSAGSEDLTEHDLRHEAACRWFTHKTGAGWTFSEIEICRIMGWTSTRMALRYASLRGEDLADRLL